MRGGASGDGSKRDPPAPRARPHLFTLLLVSVSFHGPERGRFQARPPGPVGRGAGASPGRSSCQSSDPRSYKRACSLFASGASDQARPRPRGAGVSLDRSPFRTETAKRICYSIGTPRFGPLSAPLAPHARPQPRVGLGSRTWGRNAEFKCCNKSFSPSQWSAATKRDPSPTLGPRLEPAALSRTAMTRPVVNL